MDLRRYRPVVRAAAGVVVFAAVLASPLAGASPYAVFVVITLMLMHNIGGLLVRVEKLERLLSTDEAEIAALSKSYSPASPSASAAKGPIEAGVEDAIAGYQLAGYTREQAESMAREVLRMQVKEAGGWSA